MWRKTANPVDIGIGLLVIALAIVLFRDGPHVYSLEQPSLDVSLRYLPFYTMASVARMIVAMILSLIIGLLAGYLAAVHKRWADLILPASDILQSVPVLGFFPAAVFFFIRIFGSGAIGVELAAIFLIITSALWNLIFAVYESITTIPEDLQLASRQLGLRGYIQWTRLVLPAVLHKLAYNSMISWANGWYFLIASEIIIIGPIHYRLPGLGSYLAQTMSTGNYRHAVYGLIVLTVVIVAFHLVVWSPLNHWSVRFMVDTAETQVAPQPRRRSVLLFYMTRSRFLGAIWWGVSGSIMQLTRPAPLTYDIPSALILSFLRLIAAYVIALGWTLPVAIWIGRNEEISRRVLPVIEIIASIPATAFFPLIVLFILRWGGDMNLTSILLVTTGMQWYLLFNLIAGVRAIPEDLQQISDSLGLAGFTKWKRLVLPGIYPSLVTGSLTAIGGGWNALVLSEYVVAEGRVYSVHGIGALLDYGTYESGNLQLIVMSITAMVLFILIVNRFFWQPAYHLAQRRFALNY